MQKQFYIIRHGETDWNLEGKSQGWIDVPLNSTGREQAYKSINKLKHYTVDRIISSTLSRAAETADIINSHFQVPITRHTGLKEFYLGDCEGKNIKFNNMRYARLFEQMHDINNPERDFVAYPNGECWNDVKRRLFSVFKETCNTYKENNILFITHGHIIRNLFVTLTHKSVIFDNCSGFSALYDSHTNQFSNIKEID